MSSTDAVSSLIIGGYSNISKGKSLSEETLKKLEKYGIDVTSVSSEAEAKKLIEKAEKEEAEKQSSKDNAQQESLYDRVKSLARKLGLNVSQNEDFEKIFNKMSAKIENLKGDGYGSNYNVVKSEYETLKLQYNSEIKGGSSLLSALDILGQSNKLSIGL